MRKTLIFSSIVLLFIFTLSLSVVWAQTGTTCPGSRPTRLTPGLVARVLPGDANNVRELPSRDAGLVGQIPGDATFAVIEGPECADDFTWYKVEYKGLIGWTVEGAGDEYFLEPLEVNVTATPIPSPTMIPILNNPFRDPQYPVQNTLEIGAEVITNTTLGDLVQVRHEPGTSAEERIKLPAGELLTITDGPVEMDGYRWWQIERSDGLSGWMVEGISESGRFMPLLVPVCPSEVTERAELLVTMYDQVVEAQNLYTATLEEEILCNLTYYTSITARYPISNARWSPDGRQIALHANDLYVINADGTDLHTVASDVIEPEIEWSMDSLFIAYTTSLPEQQSRHVWVVQPDGSGTRVLTSGYTINDRMRWSPVSNRLLYRQYILSTIDPSILTIGMIGADLSAPLALEFDTAPMFADWSPDGTQLALVLDITDELVILDLKTGMQTVLATLGENYQYYDLLWTPDGQTILMLEQGPDNIRHIFQVDAVTGDQTLTSYPQDCAPSHQRLTARDTGEILISGNVCPAMMLSEGNAEPLFDGAGLMADFRPKFDAR